MEEFSTLRMFGGFIGVAYFVLIAMRLQRSRNNFVNLGLLLPTGAVLVLLSAFPNLAGLPAELLNITNVKGGRLLALAIIAITLMWFALINQSRKFETHSRDLRELQVSLAASDFQSSLNTQFPSPCIIIAIPALNEAENLPLLLNKIPEKIDKLNVIILVINDGSSDDTAKIVRSFGAHVVSHPNCYDGGIALLTAYRIAFHTNADHLVTMDADCQHSPLEIEQVVRPILDGKADMVIGSRVLGSGEQYSIIRSAGVSVFSFAVGIMANQRITDCASGFRAFRVSELKKMKLFATQYQTAESIIAAIKEKLHAVEVPISIKHRYSGQSKKGHDFFYVSLPLKTVPLFVKPLPTCVGRFV